MTADKIIRENKDLDYKQNMGNYRQRKKDKLSVNRMWRDIKKCQLACEQLDKQKVFPFRNPLTTYITIHRVSLSQKNTGIGEVVMVMMMMKMKTMR